ncbi:zinc-dependent peptidase [Flavobacterium sp.]|uniref:zinc-dependent peptidase n=1 Tax=Flavobacterium sp. TaxID=239 RepID=UPI0037513463
MFTIYIILVSIIGIGYLFKILIEPIYVFIYNKPLAVHFYLFPKKLSDNHKDILSNHFTFYKRLSPKYQQYFDHRVVKFLESIQFVNRENIEITFEMKLLIASTSTMLTFGMQKYLYTVIRTIIIYPSSFYSTTNGNLHIGEFNPKLKIVVLSWKDFYKGIKIDDDNLNLGIHEFSHALLFESSQKMRYGATSNYIFSDYYNEIINDLKNSEFLKSLIDSHYFRDYAFVNSVEFIAVILEQFFETPEQFKKSFPELFYKVKQMINYDEKYFTLS